MIGTQYAGTDPIWVEQQRRADLGIIYAKERRRLQNGMSLTSAIVLAFSHMYKKYWLIFQSHIHRKPYRSWICR